MLTFNQFRWQERNALPMQVPAECHLRVENWQFGAFSGDDPPNSTTGLISHKTAKFNRLQMWGQKGMAWPSRPTVVPASLLRFKGMHRPRRPSNGQAGPLNHILRPRPRTPTAFPPFSPGLA